MDCRGLDADVLVLGRTGTGAGSLLTATSSPGSPISGNSTCTGDFTSNIIATNSNPLTLTDVTINSPGGVAVGLAGGVGVPISIVANGVTINNTTGFGGIFR